MLRLSEKEAVGVYLCLQGQLSSLDPTMARLRKRIEDALARALTIADFENVESFYSRLPDLPLEGRGSAD